MKKYLIQLLIIGLVVSLGAFIFWNTTVPMLITTEQAVEKISALPEVQDFVSALKKQSPLRHVSYRVTDSTDGVFYSISVTEADDTKETVWKRFLVNKKSAQILVENSLTGEVESYK